VAGGELVGQAGQRAALLGVLVKQGTERLDDLLTAAVADRQREVPPSLTAGCRP
jgi:hypothetical protein